MAGAVGQMEINPTLAKMYEMLSTYNLKFLEHIRKHPVGFERSHFSHAFAWKDPTIEITLQPWPLFIGQSFRNMIAEASEKVFALLKSIPGRFFGSDPARISDYYGFSLDDARRFLYGVDDEHLGNLVARGDFIFTPSGLKCLEYNVSPNLGGWALPLWEARFLQVPLISEFIKSLQIKITNKNVLGILFRHMIGIGMKWFPQEEEINLVLAFRTESLLKELNRMGAYLQQLYSEGLHYLGKSRRLKGRIIICPYDHLQLKGEDLYYQDKKVHAILDYYLGNIPLELMILFKMRKVLILNGLASVILSSKLNLALLSEHEDSGLFSAEERETIKRYVPWTRKMIPGVAIYGGEEIILEDFVLSHREQLVLKPSLGYGGQKVYLGRYTPVNQWKDLTKVAFHEKAWVIQEHIETQRLLFQWGEKGYDECDTTWGMLVFGARYAGLFMRALPPRYSKGVINVKQGAQVPIVFETGEQGKGKNE